MTTRPSALSAHHLAFNRASAGGWEPFAAHRQRLTALTAATAEAQQGGQADSLLVLGAGNCNDLDLAELASVFRTIHLADLDSAALKAARDRQPSEIAAKLVLHAPLDFSGAYEQLGLWKGKTIAAAQLAALPEAAHDRAVAALGPAAAAGFDTVLSACCLSQIMHSCFLALGRHPQLDALAEALGRVHLRLLTRLAKPGGHVLLASDTVSSETYPLEELWGTRTPRELLGEIERSANFLSGTAPTYVRRLLNTDPIAGPRLAEPARLIEPWLWQLGGDLTFLVYALVARTKG